MSKRIWIQKGLYERLQRKAEAEGISVEELVNRLMEEFAREVDSGKLSILEG